jgi:hypothetical protein
MGKTTRRCDTHGKQGPSSNRARGASNGCPGPLYCLRPPTVNVECCLSPTRALVSLEPTRQWLEGAWGIAQVGLLAALKLCGVRSQEEV